MNYLYQYKQLIRSRKKLQEIRKRQRKNKSHYFENHHIVPVCICKHRKKSKKQYNKSWNRVLLTAKEHFIAHELLYKYYLKKYGIDNNFTQKLLHAWNMFNKKSGERCYITPKSYERLRINYNIINSLPKHNLQTRKKIANRYYPTGKNHAWYGRTHSDETKEKMKRSAKNRCKKTYATDTHKKQYIIYFLCGTSVQIRGMKKWCRENGYNSSAVFKVCSGKLTHTKDIIKVIKV